MVEFVMIELEDSCGLGFHLQYKAQTRLWVLTIIEGKNDYSVRRTSSRWNLSPEPNL